MTSSSSLALPGVGATDDIVVHPDTFGTVFADLRRQGVIAMDLEGRGLCAKGEISIITVATPDGRFFIFDAAEHKDELKQDGGLKALMEDEGVQKILHDSRQDSAALFYQLDARLANVHDTSAAELALLPQRRRTHHQTHGMMLRSLQLLLERYVPVDSVEDSSIKDRGTKRMDSTNCEVWFERPLDRGMLIYALVDVRHLFVIRDKQLQRASAQQRRNIDTFSDEFAGAWLGSPDDSIVRCRRCAGGRFQLRRVFSPIPSIHNRP